MTVIYIFVISTLFVMDGWVKTQNNNSYIYNVESYNSVQQKEVSIFQLFVFLFQTQYLSSPI